MRFNSWPARAPRRRRFHVYMDTDRVGSIGSVARWPTSHPVRLKARSAVVSTGPNGMANRRYSCPSCPYYTVLRPQKLHEMRGCNRGKSHMHLRSVSEQRVHQTWSLSPPRLVSTRLLRDRNADLAFSNRLSTRDKLSWPCGKVFGLRRTLTGCKDFPSFPGLRPAEQKVGSVKTTSVGG